MHQPALYLHGAAVGVGAEPLGFVFAASQRRAAVGAQLRKLGNGCSFGAERHLHTRYLRNDLSALLYIDAVSYAYVQLAHLVLVVEGGPPDDGPAELHRLEVRHGGHRTGPSDLVVYAQQARAGLLRLELVCDRPARELGCVSELPLAFELVYLYDYAVGGVGKVFALRVPVVDIGLDLVYAAAEAGVVGDRKPPAAGGLHGLGVPVEAHGIGRNMVEHAEEPPLSDFLRVGELERAGGRVARIRKGRLLLRLPFCVQPVEGFVWHQHFAPYLELVGIASVQAAGDVGYVQRVGRDVVPHGAVAPCECLHEHACAVGETYGRPVELLLAAVTEIPSSERPVGSRHEVFYLGYGVGVAERQHGIAVPFLLESSLAPSG